MSNVDTLNATQRLEAGGYTRQQAEAMAELLRDIMGDTITRPVLQEELIRFRQAQDLVTMPMLREELARLMGGIDDRFGRIDDRFAHIDDRFAHAEVDLGHKFTALEQRMTIKLGSYLVVAVGVIAALQHFWH